MKGDRTLERERVKENPGGGGGEQVEEEGEEQASPPEAQKNQNPQAVGNRWLYTPKKHNEFALALMSSKNYAKAGRI